MNFSECPDNPYVYTWVLGECSGNGYCSQNACICDDGWTGRSDFINAEGLDCQIHKPTIRILWILSFLWVNGIYLLTLSKVRVRFRQHKELRRRYKAKGKDFRWYHNSTLKSVLAYFSTCALGFEGYSLMKIFDFDDHERVGVTFCATALFVLTIAGFYLAFFFYAPPLTRVLLFGSPNYSTLMRLSYMITLGGLVMEAADASLAFITYADGGEPNTLAKNVYLSFFAINLLCLVGYCAQSSYALYRSEQILTASFQMYQRPWILSVKRKIGRVQRQVIYECIIQGASYVAFLSWKFLWTKHDYLLPFSWAFATVLWFRIFKAVLERETKLQSSPVEDDEELGTEDGGEVRKSPAWGVGVESSLAAVPSESPAHTDAFSRTTADVTTGESQPTSFRNL